MDGLILLVNIALLASGKLFVNIYYYVYHTVWNVLVFGFDDI